MYTEEGMLSISKEQKCTWLNSSQVRAAVVSLSIAEIIFDLVR